MRGTVAVDVDVLEVFSKEEREFFKLRINDPLFQKFCALQAERAGKQLASLNPMDIGDDKAGEYLRNAQNLKMLEFFWKDLLEFSQNLARSK